MADLPTEDDLKQLPLRMIVGFAARCARRVQPFYSPANPDDVAAVDTAIGCAEEFTRTDVHRRAAARAAANAARAVAKAACGAPDAASVAATAAFAADAADAATYAAFGGATADSDDDVLDLLCHAAASAVAQGAAASAANVVRNAAHAATSDFERLRELSRERGQSFPDLGDPIDVGENGPLGPLWPDGPPEGWPTAAVAPRSLSVYLNPGDAPEELLTEFFVALASVYRSVGGSGLKFAKDECRLYSLVEAEP